MTSPEFWHRSEGLEFETWQKLKATLFNVIRTIYELWFSHQRTG